MTTAAVPASVDEVVEQLREAVDGLLGMSLTPLSGLGVVGLLEAVEVQTRRLGAVDARLLTETEQRGVAGELGRTSAIDLLVSRLHVSPTEAKARVRRAQSLAPRSTMLGDQLDPQLPEVAAAVGAGEISSAHVSVISRVLDRADRYVAHDPGAAAACERLLVQSARHEHPGGTERTGQLLLTRLDPDGPHPDEDDRRRGFTLGPTGTGAARPSGRLTPECAGLWQTVLDSLAAPRPTMLDDGREVRDDRSAEQRRHDAMVEAARMLLRSGALPDSGGVPATLLVSATLTELRRTGGVVRTAHGELIGVERIVALAGELDVELAVLGDDAAAGPAPSRGGAVLAYGRVRRIATASQRKALAARDGAGCSFPGCTRPLAWTQANHVIRWADGGRTDVANLCLVCTHHHRLLDRGDWQVAMQADGRPSWIPPVWLDPGRRPMRNTAHHLPEIDFGVVVFEDVT